MEVKEISVRATTKLATDYINGEIPAYFDYTSEDFPKRFQQLKGRTFARVELANVLYTYNTAHGASEKTFANIERFKDSDSVVVIGGQQAGILTGPLYTIHKVISIVSLARKTEQQLGVPVIPVFWIAGEDHDIQEINHIFVEEQGNVKKSTYPVISRQKKSASLLQLDKTQATQWIERILMSYEETNYTNDLRMKLTQLLNDSYTFTDFFAKLILALFSDTGIVVMDAAEENVRLLERDFFKQLIEKQAEVTEVVLKQQVSLQANEYPKTLEVMDDAANIFYEHQGERQLLFWRDEKFVTKDGLVSFSKQELLHIAEITPQLLSNNVVTRPLMQEYLFPTLAFIAGPGEIAYWAELQKAFHLFNWSMPPVISRMTMTLIERNIANDIEEINVSLSEILHEGTANAVSNWLNEQTDPHFEEEIAKLKIEIENIHRSLRVVGMEIAPHLSSLFVKNAENIQKQLDFLHHTLQKTLYEKHDVQVKKFLRVGNAIRPNNAPQERIWNVLYFLNKYGFDFCNQLSTVDYEWNKNHKLVYI